MNFRSRRPPTAHIALGLATSFGLSVLFWVGLGVFNLAGFLLWSGLIGLVGAGIGWWFGRLGVTAGATAGLRVLHFVLMVYVL